MEKRAVLGATVLWTLESNAGGVRIRCLRDGEARDVPASLQAIPLQVWTEGDDLLLLGEGFRRLRRDGSSAPAPPAEAVIEWRPSGRTVGFRYDAGERAHVPIDVRSGEALGPALGVFDLENVAWIRGELWRFEHGQLWIGGREVRLDRPIGAGIDTRIAATADALLVRHHAGIDRVDAEGHCQRIATIGRRSTILDREVFTDGRSVVWVETDEAEVELRSVPAHGGEVRVVLTRQLPEAVRIVDVYRGRVLLREEREVVDGVVRSREARGLVVIDLPPIADDAGVAAKPAGPTLHDDVARLPIRTELAARLHAAGLHRVTDASGKVGEMELRPADAAELRYALERYAQHVIDPGKPLAPIDPRFLAPVSDLELSPAVKKKIAAGAPTIAHVVTRTQADWLKTSGFGRSALAALVAALAKLGLELGMRWSDLGQRT